MTKQKSFHFTPQACLYTYFKLKGNFKYKIVCGFPHPKQTQLGAQPDENSSAFKTWIFVG